ncbi:hypothetical protein JW960_13805 [candidate division KSB1 bacterium]|nr:hypothetical protein [candidate division KSB1 bacterium]
MKYKVFMLVILFPIRIVNAGEIKLEKINQFIFTSEYDSALALIDEEITADSTIHRCIYTVDKFIQ